MPLPEANLFGIAVGFALQRLCPWRFPKSRGFQTVVGRPLIATGVYLIVRAWVVARVDLAQPQELVTSGPYAVIRNPMYVGWALLHLGVGVACGAGWVVATTPASQAWTDRTVRREEQMLEERFGAGYLVYRAAVPRYLPALRLRRTTRAR